MSRSQKVRTFETNVPQFAFKVRHGNAVVGHFLGMYSLANQICSPSATAAE